GLIQRDGRSRRRGGGRCRLVGFGRGRGGCGRLGFAFRFENAGGHISGIGFGALFREQDGVGGFRVSGRRVGGGRIELGEVVALRFLLAAHHGEGRAAGDSDGENGGGDQRTLADPLAAARVRSGD